MIIDLLIINAIVVLVFMSGFWDSMDGYINKKWKFHHLPHILQCALCQCMWLSLAYVIIVGKFSLLSLLMCLINAHLTEITLPFFTTIKNWMKKIIMWIMPR